MAGSLAAARLKTLYVCLSCETAGPDGHLQVTFPHACNPMMLSFFSWSAQAVACTIPVHPPLLLYTWGCVNVLLAPEEFMQVHLIKWSSATWPRMPRMHVPPWLRLDGQPVCQQP